jgi:hypothetical protein
VGKKKTPVRLRMTVAISYCVLETPVNIDVLTTRLYQNPKNLVVLKKKTHVRIKQTVVEDYSVSLKLANIAV